jgi:exonuclease V gamma subunit
MQIVRKYLSQYNFQFQVHQSYLLTNWGKQALDYMNNFKSYAISKKEERMS